MGSFLMLGSCESLTRLDIAASKTAAIVVPYLRTPRVVAQAICLASQPQVDVVRAISIRRPDICLRKTRTGDDNCRRRLQSEGLGRPQESTSVPGSGRGLMCGSCGSCGTTRQCPADMRGEAVEEKHRKVTLLSCRGWYVPHLSEY